MERILYTVEEVAQMLGLGRTKIYELIKLGELASVQIDRARRISGDAVDAFLARLTTPAVTLADVHRPIAGVDEPSPRSDTMQAEPDIREAS